MSQGQVDLIINQIILLGENLARQQTNTEDASKHIELIDKELSEIRSTKFDSLPDDARKWVLEMTALLETFKKQNSLTQASLKKQMEYREKLSQQTIVKIRNLFVEIVNNMDSKILALEEQKNWGISYNRTLNFSLFTERKNTSVNTALLVRQIRFRNGSSIDVMLIPGGLDGGIIEYCPQLQFCEVIKEQKTLSFSVKEKPRAPTWRMGGPPLIPDLPKPGLSDLMFDPQQESLFNEEFKTRYLSTFTQFIGSVFSKDDVRKSVPR